MRLLAGERAELVFDTRAIARADPLDRSVEQGRIGEAGPEQVVHGLGRVSQIARQLIFNRLCIIRIRKLTRVFVAFLLFESAEIDAASVDACRRAGFHATDFEAELRELRAQAVRRGIAGPASLGLRAPDVHQTLQKGSRGQNDGF